MTQYFASVNGLQVVGGTLMIPLVGAWTADLHLAAANVLTGAATVVIGNLTLKGTIYRSEPYGGQTRARLVAGAGGWRTMIASQGYGSGSGVKLSHVLGDAASACGETIVVAKDSTIANAFTRADAVASDVLWQAMSQGFIPAWRVDQAGNTQVTVWPATNVATPFIVTEQRGDEGVVVIATEDYASWMPGCTFTSDLIQGSYTSAGVNYVFDNDGKFRFEVLTGTTDRLAGALNAIIDRKVSPTRFYGRYQYTISNPSTTTVDATPVDDSINLPELQGVPIVADSISVYVPPDGGECHVMFLNGVPTRPVCVWTEGNPTHAGLLGGTTPVARIGDTVQVMLAVTPLNLTGTIQFGGSGALSAGVPYPIVPAASSLIALTPLSGTITTGSSQVDTQ
jgi:hypothetical protein